MNGYDMEIRVQDNGGLSTVAIEGEMNIYRAVELKAMLMKAIDEADSIGLDLSGVSEFDSAGLQLLLLTWKEAGKNNKKLTFSATSAPVDTVVELFNLGGLFSRGSGMEA